MIRKTHALLLAAALMGAPMTAAFAQSNGNAGGNSGNSGNGASNGGSGGDSAPFPPVQQPGMTHNQNGTVGGASGMTANGNVTSGQRTPYGYHSPRFGSNAADGTVTGQANTNGTTVTR